MKTVYTYEIFEEGIRSDGFLEFNDFSRFFSDLKKSIDNSDYRLTIEICKREVENDCDVCSQGSIKEVIHLYNFTL